jgi:hypothetical protein
MGPWLKKIECLPSKCEALSLKPKTTEPPRNQNQNKTTHKYQDSSLPPQPDLAREAFLATCSLCDARCDGTSSTVCKAGRLEAEIQPSFPFMQPWGGREGGLLLLTASCKGEVHFI